MTVRLPRKLARLDRSPVYLVHRTQQLATEIFNRELAVLDLTRPQFTLLMTISLHPKLSQKQISARTGIDQSTLGQMAARLEQRGLLQRARRPGSPRGLMLALTRKGTTLLEKAKTLAANADRNLLHTVPPAERRIVMNALTAWSDLLDEPR
ncbi:MAG: hypothetical protein C0605_00295 [Hyphomicrobiales bacterium]|nr:MAG: hypothetical protein C0605_00295 [Hyphomicrobiales bacterium]